MLMYGICLIFGQSMILFINVYRIFKFIFQIIIICDIKYKINILIIIVLIAISKVNIFIENNTI